MGRRLIMVFLALGVIGGFGSEIARHHACNWREQHRHAMMQEFARTCVDAAKSEAQQQQQVPHATPTPTPAAR